MDELVKRLRSDSKALFSAGWVKTSDLAREAADAIEQLSADLERSKEWEGFWQEEANRVKEKIQQYALAVANKPRWIPVTERLPEERTDVLAMTADCDIFVCDFIPTVRQFWTIPGDDLHIDDITHWMPLPSTEGLNGG